MSLLEPIPDPNTIDVWWIPTFLIAFTLHIFCVLENIFTFEAVKANLPTAAREGPAFCREVGSCRVRSRCPKVLSLLGGVCVTLSIAAGCPCPLARGGRLGWWTPAGTECFGGSFWLWLSLIRLYSLFLAVKYEELYCFSFNPKLDKEEREQGWLLIDLSEEYKRMGLPDTYWQLSDVNRDHRVSGAQTLHLRDVTAAVSVGSLWSPRLFTDEVWGSPSLCLFCWFPALSTTGDWTQSFTHAIPVTCHWAVSLTHSGFLFQTHLELVPRDHLCILLPLRGEHVETQGGPVETLGPASWWESWLGPHSPITSFYSTGDDEWGNQRDSDGSLAPASRCAPWILNWYIRSPRGSLERCGKKKKCAYTQRKECGEREGAPSESLVPSRDELTYQY